LVGGGTGDGRNGGCQRGVVDISERFRKDGGEERPWLHGCCIYAKLDDDMK